MNASLLKRWWRRMGLSAWLDLTKVRISAASTLTAGMGHIACKRQLDISLLVTLLGTLLLAMAASALNEFQEREIDALMARTRHRPLPSGKLSARAALAAVIGMTTVGTYLLFSTNGIIPALLGLLAMVWYNGIYTPLKRLWAFAVVPGSVIGALPPAIGWAAAGGSLTHPAMLALCFAFFLWQVPHFWLLSLRHYDDYAAVGLPTLKERLSDSQIFRLVYTWTAATVAASGLLLLFGAVDGAAAVLLLISAGVWLLTRFAWMLRRRPKSNARAAFRDINVYALALMIAVIFDGLAGI